MPASIPDRKAELPIRDLAGFARTLEVDGYAGYKALRSRNKASLAFCRADVRRKFFELANAGPSPLAMEPLARIDAGRVLAGSDCSGGRGGEHRFRESAGCRAEIVLVDRRMLDVECVINVEVILGPGARP